MRMMDNYGMYLLATPVFAAFVAVVVLGIVTVVRERLSNVSVSFFFMTIIIGIWLFGFSRMYISSSEGPALFWAKTAYLGVCFIPAAVFNFTMTVLQERQKAVGLIRLSFIISAVSYALTLLTDQLISGVYHYSWGFYPKLGRVGTLFTIYFFVVLITVIKNFWTERRKTDNEAYKLRIGGLRVAFLVGYVAAFDFVASFGLPLYPFGFIPILVFIGLLARSIWRYRLVDITPKFVAGEVINNMKDALLVFDNKGIVKVSNKAAGGMYGIQGDMNGRHITEIFSDGNILHAYESLYKSGFSQELEVPFVKGGHSRFLSISASAMKDTAGQHAATVCIARDITERRLMQEELKIRESYDMLTTIFDSMDALVYAADMKTFRILFANRYLQSSLGDVTGMVCYETLFKGRTHPCEICASGMLVDASGSPTGVHVREFQNEINGRWYDSRDRAIRWMDGRLVKLQIATDITDRKLTERQLLQSQKMEAVGQLAAGIAHDMNNFITALMGYTGMLKQITRDGMASMYLSRIVGISEKAASMTQSLLAFSSKQDAVLKPVDLNGIINSVGSLLSRLIGEHIEFKTNLHPEELPVMANPQSIEQALMNLILNARDAMSGGGRLSISTSMDESDGEATKPSGITGIGKYAVMTISDTGCGMDEDTIRKAFEPFFTTKEIGKGTGLGLSMVYGIVKQHKGFISVSSEAGCGTTFRISLPMADSIKGQKGQHADASMTLGGCETLLLAEDDPNVREITREVLHTAGYNVITAVDGQDAIDKFHANRGRIQLMLLDVIMPKQNGRDACAEIRKHEPGMKALFISGYTAEIITKDAVSGRGTGIVAKPIHPADLLMKVRDMLDGK